MSSHERQMRELLTAAREDRRRPATTTDQSAVLLTGLHNFFNPVYALLDALNAADVKFPGNNPHGAYEFVPAGTGLKRVIMDAGAIPQLAIPMTPNVSLVITVATRGELRFISDLEYAKWRCRITQRDGPDLDTRLIGSMESLAEWFMAVVAEYECQSEETEPAQPEPEEPVAPVAEEDVYIDVPPRREQRVITLDNPNLNEETQ